MAMMRKEISAGVVAFLSPMAFVLLKLAGVSEPTVTSLLTKFTSFTSTLKSLDITLVAVACVILGIVYGFIGLCGTCECRKTPLLLLASLTSIPAIFYLGGFSLFSFLLSVTFILSIYITEHSVIRATKKYKQIDMAEIVRNGTKKGVLFMTLFLSFFAMFVFLSDETYTQKALEGILPEGTSTAADSFADSLIEQQKQAKYAELVAIEQSILWSMSRSSAAGMSSEEKAACVSYATQVVNQIDPLLKKSIDDQLNTSTAQLASVSNYLELLPAIYPFIVAFTVFSIGELFKNLIISPVAGIIAWLLSKFRL